MMKPRKVKIDVSLVVPIVGQAAIAGPVADGKLIPVLTLDTSDKPQLGEIIRVHALLPPGDVKSQWASSREHADHVLLLLRFESPIELPIALRFSIEYEAILVEMIVKSNAVYLQAEEVGVGLALRMDQPRLVVEIPDNGFKDVWDELLHERMTTVMASKLGLPGRKAFGPASHVIAEMRKIAHFRLTG